MKNLTSEQEARLQCVIEATKYVAATWSAKVSGQIDHLKMADKMYRYAMTGKINGSEAEFTLSVKSTAVNIEA